MLEKKIIIKVENFLDDVRNGYGKILPYGSEVKGKRAGVQDKFVTQRVSAFSKHFNNPDLIEDETRVYMSEWLTYLCLRKMLTPFELSVYMAPAYLEAGNATRKGVDIVITKPDLSPVLGVNVKLGSVRQPNNGENFWYDNMLCAPAINTSLGNWRVTTREQDSHHIRGYIGEVVLPKVASSGKIPHLNKLERYIATNISSTVSSFKGALDAFLKLEEDIAPEKKLPDDWDKFEVLYRRLIEISRVFSSIQKV